MESYPELGPLNPSPELMVFFWLLALVFLVIATIHFRRQRGLRPEAQRAFAALAVVVGAAVFGLAAYKLGWRLGLGLGLWAIGFMLFQASDLIALLKR